MADADALEFLPLYPDDDEATILARMIAWANEGLDPEVDVDAWVDTREGGHWRTTIMPCVRDLARLYDLVGTEVIAAGMPVWAWAQYLDDHAQVQDIVRLAATAADGIALFAGPGNTFIAAGTTIGVEPVSPDQAVPEFEVITPGTIPAVAAAPSGLAASLLVGGALLASTNYRYVVTAFDDAGETTGSTELLATTTAPNKTVSIDWSDIPTALGYRVYRKTGGSAGPVYDFLAETVLSTYVDAGAVGVDAARHPPATNTTGGKRRLPIRATLPGVAGNVSANAATQFSTPPPPGVSVTNEDPITGGTEAETDESLRERVLGSFQGQGAGNKRDYERWARAWVGVGRATVIPLWNGPGTVKVIITTIDGQPASQETIDGLQNDLDPVPGLAEGRAPVSAIVTVDTAMVRTIEIAASVEFEVGYSLDGFGGTVALRAEIVQALGDYVNRVEPGGEIVVSQLVGRIVSVLGVHDARLDTLEGVAPPVNVQIDSDPAEVPVMSTPTLTDTVL